MEDSLHIDVDESHEESKTIQEALNSPVKDKYFNASAFNNECSSLIENKAWNLVKLPQVRKPVGSRWVIKVKHHADGSIDRYKVQLVAKGYSQEAGIILKRLTLQLQGIPRYVQYLQWPINSILNCIK